MIEREMEENKYILHIEDLSLVQEERYVLKNVNMLIEKQDVIALVGPSDNGKDYLLKAINRMSDHSVEIQQGAIKFNGQNIQNIKLEQLRHIIGKVFPAPNPFPLSIYENLAFGLRIVGVNKKNQLDTQIRQALQKVGLWEELRKKLHQPAKRLPLGFQQRLCLARTLCLNPQIILMDRPTTRLNSSETARFEELIFELKEKYTIIVVTEDKQQAGRISTKTAFFYKNRLIEFDDTQNIFTQPQQELTENFITGRLG